MIPALVRLERYQLSCRWFLFKCAYCVLKLIINPIFALHYDELPAHEPVKNHEYYDSRTVYTLLR
jgi:hypothetical protein